MSDISRESVWPSKNIRKRRTVSKMPRGHIINCIKHLESRKDPTDTDLKWIKVFNDELKQRQIRFIKEQEEMIDHWEEVIKMANEEIELIKIRISQTTN